MLDTAVCKKEGLSAQHLKQKKQKNENVKLSHKPGEASIEEGPAYICGLHRRLPRAPSLVPIQEVRRAEQTAFELKGRIPSRCSLSALRFERCSDQSRGAKAFHRLPSGPRWSKSGENPWRKLQAEVCLEPTGGAKLWQPTTKPRPLCGSGMVGGCHKAN